jgi:hypothetical protein
MIDQTIDIADSATNRDQALCAKIQIEARWRAASKYDPDHFGDELPLHMRSTHTNVAIIDTDFLKRLQDHEETQAVERNQSKRLPPSQNLNRPGVVKNGHIDIAVSTQPCFTQPAEP